MNPNLQTRVNQPSYFANSTLLLSMKKSILFPYWKPLEPSPIKGFGYFNGEAYLEAAFPPAWYLNEQTEFSSFRVI
jgi:hypothetical protein